METFDGGQKLRCARCRHPIIHREHGGAVNIGSKAYHPDCWRELHGFEAAKDPKWKREEQLHRLMNFDRRPLNPYGARRVA